MAFPTIFSGLSNATGAQLDGNFNALSANNGSTLIGYQPAGTGAVATTVQSQLNTLPNVVNFMTAAQYADGQTGSPVLSVASAFSQAAQSIQGTVDFVGNGPTTIVSAKTVRVVVPAGRWTLGSLVNTGGNNVIWVLDAGAFITDYANLNGRIERSGQRVSGNTNGLYDYGAGFSVIVGSPGEAGAQVMGYSSASQLGTFTSRDSVSFYGSNTGLPAIVAIAAANYTATTIVPTTPLTAAQMALLRVGMIIDTAHSPTKYSGFITGWDTVGGTFITVSGWYLSPGPGTTATPTSVGTPGASVGPNTKIWGINYNVTLNPTSAAVASSGFELGTLNNQAAPAAPGTSPICWGYDSVNLGTFKADAAFIARNSWFYGYYAKGQDTGFRYDSGNGIGLSYAAGTGIVVQSGDAAGNLTFQLSNAAAQPSIEFGNQGNISSVPGTPFFDWHSSGNANDYDFRMIASGGTTVGTGTMTFTGGTLSINSALSFTPANLNATLSPTGTGTVTINPATVGSINKMVIGNVTPDNGTFATITGNTAIVALTVSQLQDNAIFRLGTTPKKLIQATAPTIGSGFGTNPSIVAPNGTAAFQINVGTGGTASTGTITFPAATTGWAVQVSYNGASTNMNTYAVVTNTTTVTLTNQTSSTGAAIAWPSGTVLNCIAMGF